MGLRPVHGNFTHSHGTMTLCQPNRTGLVRERASNIHTKTSMTIDFLCPWGGTFTKAPSNHICIEFLSRPNGIEEMDKVRHCQFDGNCYPAFSCVIFVDVQSGLVRPNQGAVKFVASSNALHFNVKLCQIVNSIFARSTH